MRFVAANPPGAAPAGGGAAAALVGSAEERGARRFHSGWCRSLSGRDWREPRPQFPQETVNGRWPPEAGCQAIRSDDTSFRTW